MLLSEDRDSFHLGRGRWGVAIEKQSVKMLIMYFQSVKLAFHLINEPFSTHLYQKR